MSTAHNDENGRPPASRDGEATHEDRAAALKTPFKKLGEAPSDLPSESPRQTNGSSSSSSTTWEPVQLGSGQHRLPGGRITIISGINLVLFVVILAGLAIGWFWYGHRYRAGLSSWAAEGVSLLAVGLSVAALLALIIAAVKGCAIVIGWLTDRVVWAVLILGSITLVLNGAVGYSGGRGVDAQIMADCPFCSDLRSYVLSAVSKTEVSFRAPEFSKSGGNASVVCPDGRNGIRAWNPISGRVSKIQSELAMSIVTVKTKGQEPLLAALMNQVVHELDLKEDDAVVAFVKASDIRIVKDDLGTSMVRVGAQNTLSGHVVDLQNGNGLGCLTMTVDNWTLTSAMSQRAMEDLQLKAGEPVTATFQATDVWLKKG